jgi:hypothetical protein
MSTCIICQAFGARFNEDPVALGDHQLVAQGGREFAQRNQGDDKQADADDAADDVLALPGAVGRQGGGGDQADQ